MEFSIDHFEDSIQDLARLNFKFQDSTQKIFKEKKIVNRNLYKFYKYKTEFQKNSQNIKAHSQFKKKEKLCVLSIICLYLKYSQKTWVGEFNNQDIKNLSDLLNIPQKIILPLMERLFQIQIKQAVFNDEEKQLLKQIVQEQRYSNYSQLNWVYITDIYNKRIPEQSEIKSLKSLKQIFFNYLNPQLSKDSWSLDEEIILLQTVKDFGKKWFVVERHLIKRNQNQIKNRYNKIMTRLQKIKYLDLNDQEKQDIQYMESRKIRRKKLIKNEETSPKNNSTQCSSENQDSSNQQKLSLEDDEKQKQKDQEQEQDKYINQYLNALKQFREKAWITQDKILQKKIDKNFIDDNQYKEESLDIKQEESQQMSLEKKQFQDNDYIKFQQIQSQNLRENLSQLQNSSQQNDNQSINYQINSPNQDQTIAQKQSNLNFLQDIDQMDSIEHNIQTYQQDNIEKNLHNLIQQEMDLQLNYGSKQMNQAQYQSSYLNNANNNEDLNIEYNLIQQQRVYDNPNQNFQQQQQQQQYCTNNQYDQQQYNKANSFNFLPQQYSNNYLNNCDFNSNHQNINFNRSQQQMNNFNGSFVLLQKIDQEDDIFFPQQKQTNFTQNLLQL